MAGYRTHKKINLIKKKQRSMGEYIPLPHQVDLHKNPAKYRAMVSGIGAGKTTLGVREGIKFSQFFPGSLGVIGRLTSKALEETTERRFFEICPSEIIEHWNDSKKHLYLRTPQPGVYSEILFMHLDEPGPLGSLDIDWFWIDEAHEPEGTEVPESTFLMLCARLRGYAGPHRGLITTNSGGRDWVWKHFFDPNRTKEKIRDHYGVNVPTLVNKANLPKGYIEELSRNHPEAWVKRFLEGSFEVFQGQIFSEFDIRTVVVSPFEALMSWPQEAGFDFGIEVPTSVPLIRVDPATNNVYLTDLYYKAEAEIDDVAGWMKDRRQLTAWADPSVRNRGPNKKSPAMLYAEEGITLMPSVSNDVTLKISTIHQYLRKKKFFIVRSRATEPAIEEFQAYRWDPKRPDQPLKRDDHFIDSLGYLLMSTPLGMQLNPVDPYAKAETYSNVHPSHYEDDDYIPEEDEYLNP
jgi:phage terminase large subunit